MTEILHSNIKPALSVSATASVEATPDEAKISFRLNADDRSSEAALERLRKRLAELNDSCARYEIAESDRVSTVSVSEQGERKGGKWLSKGYNAKGQLRVTVRNPDVVGALVGEITATAGPAVDGPNWNVSEDHPARLEACSKAASQAQKKAETYAQALGVRLGKILIASEANLEIEPVSYEIGPSTTHLARRHRAVSDDGPVELLAGTQKVRSTIEVKYEISS